MRHSFHRPARLAACFVWLGCMTAGTPGRGAADHPGDGDSAPLVEHAGAQAEAPPPEPRVGTAAGHPQVNMAAFTRKYRPLRFLDATGRMDETGAAIERKLDDVIAKPWDFSECPLRDVVATLREELGVPIVLDATACDESGLDVDTPVSCQARGTTARFALRVLLDSIGMTWTIADGVLVVTTQEEAASNLVIRVYPLPWGLAEQRPVAAHDLVEVVQTAVAPEGWDTVGGPASIRIVESNGEALLVVAQTCAAHDTITSLLRTLHARAWDEFGDPAAPRAERRPVIRVHRLADAAARADVVGKLKDLCNASLGDAADPDATITAIGTSIAVQSRSPQFQALAGQVIVAVGGIAPPAAEVPAIGFGRTGPAPPAEDPAAAE